MGTLFVDDMTAIILSGDEWTGNREYRVVLQKGTWGPKDEDAAAEFVLGIRLEPVMCLPSAGGSFRRIVHITRLQVSLLWIGSGLITGLLDVMEGWMWDQRTDASCGDSRSVQAMYVGGIDSPCLMAILGRRPLPAVWRIADEETEADTPSRVLLAMGAVGQRGRVDTLMAQQQSSRTNESARTHTARCQKRTALLRS